MLQPGLATLGTSSSRYHAQWVPSPQSEEQHIDYMADCEPWYQHESVSVGTSATERWRICYGDRMTTRLLFAAPYLGRPSEPWLLRQIVGMQRLHIFPLCWSCEGDAVGAERDGLIHRVPFPVKPHEGNGRFLHRARTMRSGNFYATVGKERRWLMEWCRIHSPDAILAHFGYTALRLIPVGEQLNRPIIAHFHGVDLSSGLCNRWYRGSLLRNIHRFSRIVVVGQRQRDWMHSVGVPRDRVHVIPCGVPTSEFSPREIPQAPLCFVAVSRLIPAKGVAVTIRAFAEVLKRVGDARLVIVGDGPERDRLEVLAKDVCSPGSVLFDGVRTSEGVRARLAAAHVFVQHSLDHEGWWEGFGVTLAEAASMGLPVVASKCGGIMDQVVHGETGLLVPQHDVSAMATEMLKLAREPALRHQMGQAGRRRMVSHFDTRERVSQLESVIMDAIRESR